MLPYHTGRVQTNSILKYRGCCWVASVMANSARPHRRQPTRLPSPWDSPGKNTGVGCHFLLQCIRVKVKSLSCVWLSEHMDCSPPGSSVHRIFQARVLEWVAIAFSEYRGCLTQFSETSSFWKRVSCYQPLALPYVTKQGTNRSGGQESKGKWVWGSRLINMVKKWKQNVWAR